MPELQGTHHLTVCLIRCQASPTALQLLIEYFQLSRARCWVLALKMKPNLSKAKQLKKRTPRAFCHSDISNMQIEWLSNPGEQKNTL